jgi:hypothetical protein
MMIYSKISKEMLSLYFELDVFCLFEARVPEFDPQPLPLAVEMFSVQCRLNTATNHVTTEYTECWPDFFYILLNKYYPAG